ncbi:AcrR family transcriptional regulator [Actinoplanes tereljensis]|uniref:TetR family transcriptional regulator n=1 Tax=Paractinoplanes tereljensis TaxID=571912 RepID=A0A919NSP2_9ACTN|nr:TetR/AcrR family transcriptional regulator [Actinoplanes tereljensis]GIF24451.1 TetR family transcriptional regulator [Actinoplanes tereljensis]
MAYHHGDLRRALLQAADEAITEQGVAALSMRDLARRAGVSHAAPTHHFGDKAGLLTAFATSGFEQLAKALATSRLASNSFIELGVTYIRFATTRRALFEVMFRTELYHADDPELLAARAKAADALYAAVADLPGSLLVHDPAPEARPVKPGTAETAPPEVRTAGLAAWSMAHGFATLWLTGAFPDRDLDPAETARILFSELSRDFAP